MNDLSDQDLVRRALAGDKDAFGQLAERSQDIATRIALRMVANEDTALEIVQEALLEAYLSLDRLRDAGRFRSWLVGIVLNLCRSHLREQQKLDEKVNRFGRDVLDLLHDNANAPDPQEVAEERDIHRLVLSAVEDLVPAQRDAALMFYYEFLSIQEIAAISGISSSLVKVRLHRARSRLRDRLVPQLPEMGVYQTSQPRRKKMIEVRIVDVVKQGDKTVVFLLDEQGKRVLPIWIGFFEGASIVTGLRGFATSRPMTFNFVAKLLDAAGARLEEARIQAIKGDVFYGVAKIHTGDEVQEVDARPSDVLALAVRTGSPIFVTEEVLQHAGKAIVDGAGLPADLGEAKDMPLPTGEGMDAILKEVEETLRWPPAKSEAGG
jgi:RNA polymerase sigma factor (sigma-70 family)